MDAKGGLARRMARELEMAGTSFPGKPLVEIYDGCRVLIEHHLGVTEYERNQIRVKIRGGAVLVQGSHLELARVAREQLVICGCVDCVKICRKDGLDGQGR